MEEIVIEHCEQSMKRIVYTFVCYRSLMIVAIGASSFDECLHNLQIADRRDVELIIEVVGHTL